MCQFGTHSELGSSKSVLVHDFKVFRFALQFHSLSTSTLDGSEWLASRPGQLYPTEINTATPLIGRHTVPQLVEALRYKPEGRGLDSGWCHRNFSST